MKGRTGWFSGRSACYLAAGRPILAQDTGWSAYVPSGDRLLAFDGVDGACRAIEAVASAPQHHADAAREIAEASFDSRRVLRELLAYASAPPRQNFPVQLRHAPHAAASH
ncbi:MAG: hypothetical protein ABIR58_09120 [Gemmatimonadaceae bacterium]